MEPFCRRGLERGLLFRMYMEPHGTESRSERMHLEDDVICKPYREKCKGIGWL